MSQNIKKRRKRIMGNRNSQVWNLKKNRLNLSVIRKVLKSKILVRTISVINLTHRKSITETNL